MPPALVPLGWDDRCAAQFSSLTDLSPGLDLVSGRVARVDRGAATVALGADPNGDLDTVSVPTRAAIDVTVGDWVLMTPAFDRIEHVHARWSGLDRRRADGSASVQTLAANIDVVGVVHGLHREPNLRRIERELVAAWDSGATPAVILTKIDLMAPGLLAESIAAVEQVALGVDVIAVSTVTGEGMDVLATALAGRTVVFLGSSGVGKSSIANALAGRSLMAVGDVRTIDGKGRHTTTAGQLLVVGRDTLVIDTPGLRALALWDSDGDGLERTFSDIDELAPQCRFSDCAHDREPGCAVRDAVAPERIDSWRRLQRELDRTSGDVAGWQKAAANQARRRFARMVREVQPRI